MLVFFFLLLLFVVIQSPKGGRFVFHSKMVHEQNKKTLEEKKSFCGSLIGHSK